MIAPVVVFAVGNPSRGDDAIGPLLLERLAAWLAAEGLDGHFDLVEDFQLQIEHSLDLQGRRLALFIDAGVQTPVPYSFLRIAPASGFAHTTHELPPEAVLQVFRQTEAAEPPPAFTLCVSGERFELGEPLSPAAEAHAAAAFATLGQLCRDSHAAAWERLQFSGNAAVAPAVEGAC
ncbi:MAG: homospermidine synthase [Betaproteobacteria bacterium HGW-Betaproteobacteria-7]|jgi:hydrogenase maturation protease|nr:MAG: homospermidine synthase [Betaproteobacteria bacterium HGW-Betaproteobacteria-7]